MMHMFFISTLNPKVVVNGSAIVRKILEKYPESAHKLDKNGYSPLHHACSRGQPEITTMLLRQDPQQAFQFTESGYAPVHLAAINGSPKVLQELLLTAPTCFELLSRKGETVFHLMVKFDRFDAFLYISQVFENRSLLCRPDKNGDTCLHLAISLGNYNIAEYIIKEAAEQINCRNSWGDTAMDLLDQSENTSTSMQILRYLLEAEGGKRKSELADTVPRSDIGSPKTTQPSPSNEIDDSRTTTRSEFSVTNALTSHESPDNMSGADNTTTGTIPKFGDPSDQETSSKKKKRLKKRLRQYKRQSEISRKSLIHLYQRQQRRHEVYREALHNARETIILIAVLIATVTYTSGINPPGGVYQDGSLRGTAVAGRRTSFKVFSICNNVALFASLSIVIVLVSIIPFRRKPLMMMLMVAHKAMWVAVGFMAAAYFAASLVLMPPPHGGRMEWTVVSLLSICAGSLGSVFVVLGFMLMRHQVKKMRYRKRIVDAESTSVESIESNRSKNSDLSVSDQIGYHAY